jgi:hypothetical protein
LAALASTVLAPAPDPARHDTVRYSSQAPLASHGAAPEAAPVGRGGGPAATTRAGGTDKRGRNWPYGTHGDGWGTWRRTGFQAAADRLSSAHRLGAASLIEGRTMAVILWA